MNEDRRAFLLKDQNSGEFFFLQLALWDQGWGGRELKSYNPLDLQTREGGDKKGLEGYTTRDDVRHGVSTVHLLHMPTQGPERQEVINKGQGAYQRTGVSRSYQQRPECLPKNQSIKKLSTKTRVPNWSGQQEDRHDGNHTRIGRSYTMALSRNISSHRELGDLTVEPNERQGEGRTRPLSEQEKKCKKQTTRQHMSKRLRHQMHDKH